MTNGRVPPELQKQVKVEYSAVRTGDPQFNSILKLPVVTTGDQGAVHIDELLGPSEAEEWGRGGGANINLRGIRF